MDGINRKHKGICQILDCCRHKDQSKREKALTSHPTGAEPMKRLLRNTSSTTATRPSSSRSNIPRFSTRKLYTIQHIKVSVDLPDSTHQPFNFIYPIDNSISFIIKRLYYFM